LTAEDLTSRNGESLSANLMPRFVPDIDYNSKPRLHGNPRELYAARLPSFPIKGIFAGLPIPFGWIDCLQFSTPYVFVACINITSNPSILLILNHHFQADDIMAPAKAEYMSNVWKDGIFGKKATVPGTSSLSNRTISR
jgi:hypothetical protein